MITTSEITQVRQQVHNWHRQGKTVALVPTMGNLHQGHLILLEEAQKRADHVVVYIFVNPMQFGQNEDFDRYPRTLEQDKQTLLATGVELLLFTPTLQTIYPKGLEAQTFVDVPQISDKLCGNSRTGHFQGVATVICKMLNIVQPDMAFFGQKDYQQLLVLKTMVEDLSMPVSVIGVDTERDSSGLALSSRNQYLSEQQKKQSAMIYSVMEVMKTKVIQGKDLDELITNANAELTEADFRVDYIHICDARTLEKAQPHDKQLVILIAAYLGSTRLIDNMTLTRE